MQHYRQTTYKTAAEIKAAVDKGVRVFQHNSGYEVIKDSEGQYLIAWLHGTSHASYIRLTGKPEQFYSLHEDDPANS